MQRCALLSALPAIPAGLVMMAMGPPEAWLAAETPIAAGWIALAVGCNSSRRLRSLAAAGTITRTAAAIRFLLFPILFTVTLALASVLGLAATDAVGLSRGHMTGLQPYVFGLGGLVTGLALWLVHAWLSWRASPDR